MSWAAWHADDSRYLGPTCDWWCAIAAAAVGVNAGSR
jgi:hypothetical protein